MAQPIPPSAIPGRARISRKPWLVAVALITALASIPSVCHAQKRKAPNYKAGYWKTDPYTKNDKAVMKKLGYKSFGPFPWGDDHSSADIAKMFPDRKLLFVETAHFRIVSSLPAYAMPRGAKLEKKILKADLTELKKSLTKRGLPHLFIAASDGTSRVNFNGLQAQSYLQKQLIKLIDISYKKKPLPAVKSVIKFLSKFDMYDMREDTLLVQIDEAREANGPKSSTVKKFRKQLAEVRKKKAQFMKMAKAVCDLKLKVTTKKPKAD